jgi:hypothetical protein
MCRGGAGRTATTASDAAEIRRGYSRGFVASRKVSRAVNHFSSTVGRTLTIEISEWLRTTGASDALGFEAMASAGSRNEVFRVLSAENLTIRDAFRELRALRLVV